MPRQSTPGWWLRRGAVRPEPSPDAPRRGINHLAASIRIPGEAAAAVAARSIAHVQTLPWSVLGRSHEAEKRPGWFAPADGLQIVLRQPRAAVYQRRWELGARRPDDERQDPLLGCGTRRDGRPTHRLRRRRREDDRRLWCGLIGAAAGYDDRNQKAVCRKADAREDRQHAVSHRARPDARLALASSCIGLRMIDGVEGSPEIGRHLRARADGKAREVRPCQCRVDERKLRTYRFQGERFRDRLACPWVDPVTGAQASLPRTRRQKQVWNLSYT
jgi:hypothetical protein